MLRFLSTISAANFCRNSKLNVRTLQCRKFSDKSVDTNVKQSSKIPEGTSTISGKIHVPSAWHRFILVWAKVYKSKEEIPKNVSYEAIDKAKNIVRIKISNYMILATIIACIVVAINGRRAAERGETVSKLNLEWHRKVKEDAEKEKLNN